MSPTPGGQELAGGSGRSAASATEPRSSGLHVPGDATSRRPRFQKGAVLPCSSNNNPCSLLRQLLCRCPFSSREACLPNASLQAPCEDGREARSQNPRCLSFHVPADNRSDGRVESQSSYTWPCRLRYFFPLPSAPLIALRRPAAKLAAMAQCGRKSSGTGPRGKRRRNFSAGRELHVCFHHDD